MILFGWGRKTIKLLGESTSINCNNCNNKVNYQFMKVTTWFTIYFLPIIPYSVKYLEVCPICNNSIQIDKSEINKIDLSSNINDTKKTDDNNSSKYAGKNETQINYLKQMDEQKKNK